MFLINFHANQKNEVDLTMICLGVSSLVNVTAATTVKVMKRLLLSYHHGYEIHKISSSLGDSQYPYEQCIKILNAVSSWSVIECLIFFLCSPAHEMNQLL